MIIQVVKLSVKQSSREKHKRTQQGASAKLESYLYCYRLVYTTTSYLSHILLKAIMCPDIIFQILLSCSGPMTSHHVTCHVTAMSHASLLSIIRKRKSRKIDKRKRKMSVSKAFYNGKGLDSTIENQA